MQNFGRAGFLNSKDYLNAQMSRTILTSKFYGLRGCPKFKFVCSFERPCVRPSDRPSVRPSVHPSEFGRSSARPNLRPSVRSSVRPTVRPSVRPLVRPTVRPSGRQSKRADRPTMCFSNIYPGVTPTNLAIFQNFRDACS